MHKISESFCSADSLNKSKNLHSFSVRDWVGIPLVDEVGVLAQKTHKFLHGVFRFLYTKVNYSGLWRLSTLIYGILNSGKSNGSLLHDCANVMFGGKQSSLRPTFFLKLYIPDNVRGQGTNSTTLKFRQRKQSDSIIAYPWLSSWKISSGLSSCSPIKTVLAIDLVWFCRIWWEFPP